MSPAMIARLIGRRAPPARQQRGVQVEAAVTRRIEDRLRQDQPIGHDDRDIGVERDGSAPAPRRSSAAPACAPVQARLLGEPAHGGFAQGHAPPRRARRLGVDGDDLVPRLADRSASVGTAKSGVPMKMMRIGGIRPYVTVRGKAAITAVAVKAPNREQRARARQEEEHRKDALLDVPAEQAPKS